MSLPIGAWMCCFGDGRALLSLTQIIHAQMGLATEPEAQADMVQRYQKQITDEQGVC